MGKDICEKQLFHLVDRMEKVEVDYSQIESYLPNIYKKLEWLDREELIKKFVSLEFNRFLEYYRTAKDLNEPMDRGKVNKRDRNSRVEGFTRFFINLGNLDNLKPTQLIGLINDTTGKRDIEIGEIDIKKSFSFFELDSAHVNLVLSSFDGAFYNDRAINIEVAEKKRDDSRGDGGRRRSGRKSERSRGQERSFGNKKSFAKKESSPRSEKPSKFDSRKGKNDRSDRNKRDDGKKKSVKAWRNK
jgi:ATP-dependent RNA helicase DeaD